MPGGRNKTVGPTNVSMSQSFFLKLDLINYPFPQQRTQLCARYFEMDGTKGIRAFYHDFGLEKKTIITQLKQIDEKRLRRSEKESLDFRCRFYPCFLQNS